MALSFRTVWISDVHLGNPAARADDLLQFLDNVRCEHLYLVGDIIDLKRMKARPAFPQTHVAVLRRVLELVGHGTQVTYIPGNHDHEFRDLVGRDLCGVHVDLESEHETADGRRLLITHGDVLDAEVRHGTNLEQFGAAAYDLMLVLDAKINGLRHRLGREHLSISTRIKARLASANEYMRRFEDAAARYAERRDFQGIVCGHIHRPGIRTINGICYANDGDWVEHRTALAETDAGKLRLLSWTHQGLDVQPTTDPAAALAA